MKIKFKPGLRPKPVYKREKGSQRLSYSNKTKCSLPRKHRAAHAPKEF